MLTNFSSFSSSLGLRRLSYFDKTLHYSTIFVDHLALKQPYYVQLVFFKNIFIFKCHNYVIKHISLYLLHHPILISCLIQNNLDLIPGGSYGRLGYRYIPMKMKILKKKNLLIFRGFQLPFPVIDLI